MMSTSFTALSGVAEQFSQLHHAVQARALHECRTHSSMAAQDIALIVLVLATVRSSP